MAHSKQTLDTRWTPRRLPGGVFCAPACGGRCRRSAYVHAVRASRDLAQRISRRLRSKWHPRVWENLGWHWQVISPSGRWRVGPAGDGDWLAFFGNKYAEHGTTPQRAMEAVRERFVADFGRMKELAQDIGAAP